MSKEKRVQELEEAFVQGFAAALTTLVRTYDEPTLARDVAACNGYDLRDFVFHAVGQFELDALKKAFAAPTPKRRKK